MRFAVIDGLMTRSVAIDMLRARLIIKFANEDPEFYQCLQYQLRFSTMWTFDGENKLAILEF